MCWLGYVTKLNPVIRLQFWRSRECGIQLYRYFKRLTSDLSQERNLYLRKGNFREKLNLFYLQHKTTAKKTNHLKARIDKTQQNSMCRFCSYGEETIDQKISESSRLEHKEYFTRYDWVGKVIHRELCKKFKFDHTNKWYKHNRASILENETHKLLWNFEIQADHLISIRPCNNNNNKKRKQKTKKRTC